MFSRNMQLAWHFYLQQKHAPHQRLLRYTQSILLFFIITLSLTSHSIQDYLAHNLEALLGADAVISQSQALSAQQSKNLTKLTSKIVSTQQLSTTLTHNNQWQQVTLKTVPDSYPLHGRLLTATDLHGKTIDTKGSPAAGEIWLDARLFVALSLSVGESITVAEQHFTVSRILVHEPDRIMQSHSVEMRAMVHPADFQHLIQPDDQSLFRYLLDLDDVKLPELIRWQQQNLPGAALYHKKGKHPLALFWQRTENVIGIASIVLFFMAAIAIEQLTQVHKHQDRYFSAICMSFGASRSTGITISLLKWFLSIVHLLPVVLLLSYLMHYGVISWLNKVFPAMLWQPSFLPTIKSIGAMMLVLAVFHLPVWLSLYHASVARLFKNNHSASHWSSRVCAAVVLVGAAVTYSDNALLTAMMVSIIVVTIAFMITMSWLCLTLGEKLTQRVSGLIPFTLFMMKQRLLSKSTQIIGVGLCAFLLLFTLMLLKDLGATMSSYTRQHDGNLIVSQATEPQMQFLQNWAQTQHIVMHEVKPFMYAKLVRVNGQNLADFSTKPSDSLATLSQAIRLHWSDTVPKNNTVVSGKWWQPTSQVWQQVSVEQEIMTDLGLSIGDSLSLVIGNQSIDFRISASHKFKSGAGSITFWVQMPASAVPHIAATHYSMTSLELSPSQFQLLGNLWQKFPSLRMTSLQELTEKFDAMLALITRAISGFAVMIILLALVVILASINALESKEKKKNSIIMSFGLTKGTCLRLNLIEWLVTASTAASGAILGTYFTGVWIYQAQFSLTYQPNALWLAGTLASILVTVSLLGVFASHRSLQSSIRSLMSET